MIVPAYLPQFVYSPWIPSPSPTMFWGVFRHVYASASSNSIFDPYNCVVPTVSIICSYVVSRLMVSRVARSSLVFSSICSIFR